MPGCFSENLASYVSVCKQLIIYLTDSTALSRCCSCLLFFLTAAVISLRSLCEWNACVKPTSLCEFITPKAVMGRRRSALGGDEVMKALVVFTKLKQTPILCFMGPSSHHPQGALAPQFYICIQS